MSAYRTDCLGWSEGEAGHAYRLRRPERPLCGQRRWPGSHITCALYAHDEGLHESAEGDQWEDGAAAHARAVYALRGLVPRPVEAIGD